MANIDYSPTEVSNFKAPDITKAGALITSGLNKLATTAKQVETGIQESATDQFQNALRQAKTQEELAQLDPTSLGQSYVDAAGIQQAESALRNKQFDVFGASQQDQYTANVQRNREAIQNILNTNPDLASRVTLDAGFNPRFATPTGTGQDLVDSQAQIEADKNAFGLALQKSTFQPVRTERQANLDIREFGKSKNATPVQIAKMEADFKGYKDNLNKLTSEDQAIVNAQSEQFQELHELKLQEVAFEKQQRAAEYGYTSEEALAVLHTKPTEVIDYINKNMSQKVGWWEWYDITVGDVSGVDFKNLIVDVSNRLTGNKDTVKPWMFLQATKEAIDDERVDKQDFEARIEQLANPNNPENANLQAASKLDAVVDKAILKMEQQLKSDQRAIAGNVLGKSGVTDTIRNTQLFNKRYQEAVDQADQSETTISESKPTPTPEPKPKPLEKPESTLLEKKATTVPSNITGKEVADLTQEQIDSIAPEDFDEIESPKARQEILHRTDTSIAYSRMGDDFNKFLLSTLSDVLTPKKHPSLVNKKTNETGPPKTSQRIRELEEAVKKDQRSISSDEHSDIDLPPRVGQEKLTPLNRNKQRTVPSRLSSEVKDLKFNLKVAEDSFKRYRKNLSSKDKKNTSFKDRFNVLKNTYLRENSEVINALSLREIFKLLDTKKDILNISATTETQRSKFKDEIEELKLYLIDFRTD